MSHTPFSDESIRLLLKECRTIAVVGAKDKPGQPVDEVGRYLLACGYTIIPIHPKRKDVWGLTTYASLAEVPVPVDIVDVFRAPDFCAGHARETLRLASRPRCFWMQLGISNKEAESLVEDAGILSVSDKCIKIEHARLLGAPPGFAGAHAFGAGAGHGGFKA